MNAAVAHLRALTGLRFLAALAACSAHLVMMATWEGRPPFPSLAGWTAGAYAAVPFFFVLSGFVLTWNYQAKFRELQAGRVGGYLRARFARAYPLHFLTFLLALATPFGWHGWNFGFFYDRFWRAFSVLTLTQGFWPRPDFYQLYNPVAWSLSAEALFYVAFPFLVWGLARAGDWRPGTCVAIAAGMAAVRVIGAACLPLDTSIPAQWAWFVFPPARLPEFLVGMFLALAFRQLPTPAWGRFSATAAELGVVAVFIVQVALAPRLSHGFCMGGYYVPTLGLAVWVFASGRGWLSAALSVRPLQYLGEMSYSLYMLHFLFLWTLLEFRNYWLPAGWSPEAVSLSALGVTLLACAASFHLVETPLRRLIAGSPRKPAPTPAAIPMRRAA
jgi:peptidoglycan/LPS O-acetylase OafA/YrhL